LLDNFHVFKAAAIIFSIGIILLVDGRVSDCHSTPSSGWYDISLHTAKQVK